MLAALRGNDCVLLMTDRGCCVDDVQIAHAIDGLSVPKGAGRRPPSHGGVVDGSVAMPGHRTYPRRWRGRRLSHSGIANARRPGVWVGRGVAPSSAT